MKYKAIIETDDYKNFEFFEDGNGKYIHGIDAGAVNNEWIALYFTECEQEPCNTCGYEEGSIYCKEHCPHEAKIGQEPCEMTAEEYKQRMIQAFHNADCDGLIAICVLPTEKEFEHLEWLLKNHYKKESCDDAISRQAVIDMLNNAQILSVESGDYCGYCTEDIDIDSIPSVNPQPKTGHWIEHPEIETSTPEYLMFYECSECGDRQCFCKSDIHKKRFCSNCGCRMVEPQERSDKE